MASEAARGPWQTLQRAGVEPIGTAEGSSGNGIRYLKLPKIFRVLTVESRRAGHLVIS
jgi:hypothetical protein